MQAKFSRASTGSINAEGHQNFLSQKITLRGQGMVEQGARTARQHFVWWVPLKCLVGPLKDKAHAWKQGTIKQLTFFLSFVRVVGEGSSPTRTHSLSCLLLASRKETLEPPPPHAVRAAKFSVLAAERVCCRPRDVGKEGTMIPHEQTTRYLTSLLASQWIILKVSPVFGTPLFGSSIRPSKKSVQRSVSCGFPLGRNQ